MTTIKDWWVNHKLVYDRCNECKLARTRSNVVHGELFLNGGATKRVLMFGEAPGQQEDRDCLPFVGRTGKYMRKCWHALQFPDSDISYLLTNTVGCRPPYNADPTDKQKKACMPRMQDIVRGFQPHSVICIGKHAQNFVAYWSDTLGFTRLRVFHVPHPRYGQTLGRRAYESLWANVINQL